MIIYIAIGIAAVVQAATIYLLRTHFHTNIWYATPLILFSQLLFLWSYAHAPKFITVWFITTAVTNGLAFVLGYYLLQEQISFYNTLGILFVIVGIVLLNVKI